MSFPPRARRRLVPALVGLALALVAAPPAGAAAPAPFSFSRISDNLQYPVEQQSPGYFYDQDWSTQDAWVKNPTTCAWDVDDQIKLVGFGRLAAGTSVSGSLCVVADGYDNFGGDDHMLMLTVTAARPTLKVTLSGPDGVRTLGAPVTDPAGYRWHACVVDHTPGPYPVIAGSNGGTGTVATYTASIALPSGARDPKPYAVFEAPLVGTPAWFAARAAGCV